MSERDSLFSGAKVQVHGLINAPHLNGAQGKLHGFDADSGRWQVETKGSGYKKIKPENLALQPLSDSHSSACSSPRTLDRRCRKSCMCRYGNMCWRPNCHFAHQDNAKRCEQWASFWSQEGVGVQQKHDSGMSVDSSSQAKVISSPPATDLAKLMSDVSELDKKLSASIQELSDLREQVELVELAKLSECPEETAVARLEMVQVNFEALEQRVDSFLQCDIRAQLECLQADIDDRLGEKLNTRMLGTLQAAVTPLADPLAEFRWLSPLVGEPD